MSASEGTRAIPSVVDISKMSELFLGFDLSTQQLKALLVGEQFEVVKEENIHFDSELPEFRTKGGVIIADDEGGPPTVYVPTLLWIKALDLILQKLQRSDIPMSKISAISASAQQHGSVYWKSGTEAAFPRFNPFKSLWEQMADLFSVPNSPIWMDSSTTDQCRKLEDSVGGPEVLANVTGSRAYERFTGPQIAKIYSQQPEAYENTERISLISSFLSTILMGRYAAIDWSDGSGMNLMDIRRKHWDPSCLAACAPDLKKKLNTPCAPWTVIGTISEYFAQRYGFSNTCSIVACTGDNPSSLAGMNLHSGDICISLGTSDTISAVVTNPKPSLEGHILCSPVKEDEYMAMVCFKNGALMREKVLYATTSDGTWAEFEEKLYQRPPGNEGLIGLYYDQMEIVPQVQGYFRFDAENHPVSEFTPEEEVRALFEGQSIAKRYHAQCLGFRVLPETRIFVTGGGSRNTTLLQIIANVFQADVYTQAVSNSAAYGAACRAIHGLRKGNYFDMLRASSGFPATNLAVRHDPDLKSVYDKLVDRYGKLHKQIVEEFGAK